MLEWFTQMFRPKTLFVVGAGASKEAKLPTANELTATIAGMIDIKFHHDDQFSGDFEITAALRRHVQKADGTSGDISPYLRAGRLIRDAMPQAISIDNFIDAHQGDEKVELCGKLAIVRSILDAEQHSLLFFDGQWSNDTINHNNLQETWYISFMQLLTEGFHRENISQLFENVSFIIFNYDRCIEHFLFHAVQTYYGIQSAVAADLMRALKIFHPYGIVGYLPWQADEAAIPFGSSNYESDLLSLARQIKTFTERIEDETAITAMRRLMQDAETIVFLGFAFHQQNMELMKPIEHNNAIRVFATAKGISDSDCIIIRGQICQFFDKMPHNIKVNLRNGLTCHGIFEEYRRSLSL